MSRQLPLRYSVPPHPVGVMLASGFGMLVFGILVFGMLVIGMLFFAPHVDAQEGVPASASGAPAQITFTPDETGDRFGDRIAFQGDTLVVSAPRTAAVPGGVFIYQRANPSTNRWALEREIPEPNTSSTKVYAVRVAVLNDVVAVTYADTIYIFARNQGGAINWGLVGTVVSPDGAGESGFGESLALTSNLLIAGAPLYKNSNGTVGAVYLINRTSGNPNTWPLVRKLMPTATGTPSGFGDSIALSQNWLAVSAPTETPSGNTTKGAVYLYSRDSGGANNWGQVHRLLIDDIASPYDQLSLLADTLVVSRPLAIVDGKVNAGAVHVFMRNQGGANAWGQSARVVDLTPSTDEGFGMAAVTIGNALIVSRASTDSQSGSSALLVYSRESETATTWTFFRSQIVQGLTGYGREIVAEGTTVMVSAPWHNLQGESSRGMVFSYRRDVGGPANWGLGATIVGPGCTDECGQEYYGIEAISLINIEREKVGCAKVGTNPLLDQTALVHSTDMAVRNYYAHTSPEGVDFTMRIQDAGYFYSRAGEVLFKGPQTPEEAVNGWMGSQGHRDILMNCELTEIGMGLWSDPASDNALFWTGVVGRPSSDFLKLPPPGVTVPPIEGQSPYALALNPSSTMDGLPIGSMVGTFVTSDLDLPNDFHEYTLVGDATYPDNAKFLVQGSQLRTGVVLNEANGTVLKIQVMTTDSLGNTLVTPFNIAVSKATQVDMLPFVWNQP